MSKSKKVEPKEKKNRTWADDLLDGAYDVDTSEAYKELDKIRNKKKKPKEEEPMSEKDYQLMVSANIKIQHKAYMETNNRQRELINLAYENEVLRREVYKLKLESLKRGKN